MNCKYFLSVVTHTLNDLTNSKCLKLLAKTLHLGVDMNIHNNKSLYNTPPNSKTKPYMQASLLILLSGVIKIY